jgi:hypothetical protein
VSVADMMSNTPIIYKLITNAPNKAFRESSRNQKELFGKTIFLGNAAEEKKIIKLMMKTR